MAEPVRLPAMGEAQEQSWNALMDVHERIDQGWALIGGQLVHLHCAERGELPPRPTDDIDAVVDIRASTSMLETFTDVLAAIGFRPDTSADGVQHRWRRDLASLVSAADFRETELTTKDKQRLRAMLDRCRSESAAMVVEHAAESMDRLVRGAGL